MNGDEKENELLSTMASPITGRNNIHNGISMNSTVTIDFCPCEIPF
jgi:hypothetical protein